YMDKCLEIPVAMYGIMKAGGAYVPLDPSAPVERTRDIIRDCGIKLLLTHDQRCLRLLDACSQEEAVFPEILGVSKDIDDRRIGESWSEIDSQFEACNPGVKILESDLAYIIYTSGSTGVPKGIMHSHHSGLSFATWAAREYRLSGADRVSNHAPLHFDLSIFDYFATLVAGGSVVIIPEEYTKLPASYSQLIADYAINVLFTVPFALIQLGLRGALEQRDLSRLRLVIFGGEPMPAKYLSELMARLPSTSFDNMYGPAEINGCSHFMLEAPPLSSADIPIGAISEIADSLIVNSDDVPVPVGEAGHLLVRTPTMMLGYWKRPKLNEQAYFRVERAGQEWVYYRTGDLVRADEEGVMFFLGRVDRQIKVRGYRVELDEIEAALTAHEAIEEAAIFAVTDEHGQAEIRGAVIHREGPPVSGEELLAYLKKSLPWYAVPVSVQQRDEFPRTSTGKIDRREIAVEENQ
ncbi:MAG: amino acid adenylation domain-containing protein, partial [Thiogranum sp.]